MRRTRWLIMMCVLGCATSHVRSSDALLPGNSEEAPSMETLPTTDVPHERFSEKMRFAWLLAEQTFELESPSIPDHATAQEIQVWSDSELHAWLNRKNRMVDVARAELDEAAAESHRQRIVAGALVGLMYEDVARVLSEIPLPSELDDEPEIQDVYRDVVAFQARPYVEHARRAYNACARNARQPETMRHWSRYCRARAGNLPAANDTIVEGVGGPSGETTVEVIRE